MFHDSKYFITSSVIVFCYHINRCSKNIIFSQKSPTICNQRKSNNNRLHGVYFSSHKFIIYLHGLFLKMYQFLVASCLLVDKQRQSKPAQSLDESGPESAIMLHLTTVKIHYKQKNTMVAIRFYQLYQEFLKQLQ